PRHSSRGSLSIDDGEAVTLPIVAGSIGQQVGRAATLALGMGKPVRRQARSDSGRTPGLRHRDRTQENVGAIRSQPATPTSIPSSFTATAYCGPNWAVSSNATSLLAERSSAIVARSPLSAGRIEMAAAETGLDGESIPVFMRSKSDRSN